MSDSNRESMEKILSQASGVNRISKKLTKKKIFLRIIMVILGACIMAISLELFLVPNKVLDGGIVGISIIISHLTGLH